jgi:thiamine-phosphate pyrophosphorylase
MKPLTDCRLYTFVDRACLRGRPPEDVAHQLCDGGSDLVQLRAKDATAEEVEALAERLLPITTRAGVGLVINDHPEVARRVGAPLCHLGQEDFFGAGHQRVDEVAGSPRMFQLGLSTHAPEQARRAVEAGADYVAIGPVFATPTKPDRPPVTLDYVRWAAAHVRLPWFAIGGIQMANLEAVLEAGARRVCVVSAVLLAPDVVQACQQFKQRLLSVPL